MQTVVRMVHVCMDSFPTVFGPTNQAFCFQLMQRLLGLLTLQKPVECVAVCMGSLDLGRVQAVIALILVPSWLGCAGVRIQWYVTCSAQ